MKRFLGYLGIAVLGIVLLVGLYLLHQRFLRNERIEVPAVLEDEREAVPFTVQSVSQPTNVVLGTIAGGVTNRYDIAETGYASNVIAKAVKAGMDSLVSATNLAIQSKARIEQAISLEAPPASSGVRLHVYGQEDYDLAETSFVTNFTTKSVVGAVTNLVHAINEAAAKRDSLVDQYLMSDWELIADYTFLQEVKVLPAHVHMETQIPLGIETPIVASNILLYSGVDTYRPSIWTNYLVNPPALVTNYPTIPWRAYFRVTNDVNTLVLPFTAYGQWVTTNSPLYFSRPNLSFYPQEAGMYNIVIEDMTGNDSYAGFPSVNNMGAKVTVSKSANSDFTIEEVVRKKQYDPYARAKQIPPKPQETELVHYTLDSSTLQWIPMYKVDDVYLIISYEQWIEWTDGTGHTDWLDDDEEAQAAYASYVAKAMSDPQNAVTVNDVVDKKVEELGDDRVRITVTREFDLGGRKELRTGVFVGKRHKVVDEETGKERTVYSGHWLLPNDSKGSK